MKNLIHMNLHPNPSHPCIIKKKTPGELKDDSSQNPTFGISEKSSTEKNAELWRQKIGL